ncbi:hypothetical protein GCM10022198_09910 [Klugiella xanthotipulae]|uniref:O-antigen ligase n=1 Tax=Klugiella xanthotipulae TaxID=244735 RepID=A0A543HYJ1_9MICO|nr:O-antigen ligase family protein [Klugiella xanthotipulae]TQM63389.1 O-antigen ligase [Klugiella xanthotipulae]
MTAPRRLLLARAQRFLGSAEFTSILSTLICGVLFASYAIERLIGTPGFAAMIGTLVLAAIASAVSRREEIEWNQTFPLTLVAFMAWCIISLSWASRTGATWSSLSFQVAVAILGLYIGTFRDLIQIVRSLGDAFRALLTVALGLELLSGILIDTPLTFLGIQGNLGAGGPVQGIFGSRNLLAFVAVIALITFVTEWRTRSVPPGLSLYSGVIALTLLFFTRSPIQLAITLCVILALGALLLVRRQPAASKGTWQIGMFALAALVGLLLWSVRNALVFQLRATRDLEARISLWRSVWDTARQQPLEGWGWVGAWPNGTQPYFAINFDDGTKHQSALNAFADLYLQLGIVGLVLFTLLLMLALVRSTLVATNKRSDVYLWPALILIVLALTSLVESTALTGPGWFMLVVAAAISSRQMSWRNRLRPTPIEVSPGRL